MGAQRISAGAHGAISRMVVPLSPVTSWVHIFPDLSAAARRSIRVVVPITLPAWTATMDSLRIDLTRMPDMTATELQAFMPAHHGRVTRLTEMHRAMMGGM